METAHLGIEGGSGERRTAPVDDVAGVIDTTGPGHVAHAPHAHPTQPVEGVEIVGQVENAPVPEVKPKRPRAKVRFGGEDDRPTIRHDRPELYDF